MKNKIGCALVVISLVGCSSAPRRETKEDLTSSSLTQDSYLEEREPDLPVWTTQSGFKDGFLVGVGVAEGSADQSPIAIKRAAMMDAESQLFSKAPHEYREAVQHAVDESGAKFVSVQTKLLKLSGVSGVIFPPDKSYCHKAARHTGEYAKISRVCYQQAQIPIEAMNRAIEKTLEQYYSDKVGNKFTKLMNSEMKTIQGESNEAKAESPTHARSVATTGNE